uniref:Uncharacterized protein n=1 Tax=Meleagris gallopavo TaxID=9103 RepID=A0A803XMS9_MELGA
MAATGDMPSYQLRTPTTNLPQGVVMAASPGALHSPQQLAEEATRKRELRLMKNSKNPNITKTKLINSYSNEVLSLKSQTLTDEYWSYPHGFL